MGVKTEIAQKLVSTNSPEGVQDHMHAKSAFIEQLMLGISGLPPMSGNKLAKSAFIAQLVLGFSGPPPMSDVARGALMGVYSGSPLPIKGGPMN